MKNVATIILAAGKGTRMKSDKPKVLFSLADKSLIQRVIDTSRELDAKKIVVVVGYKKDEVTASIEDKSRLIFVEQKQQNGTGDAVRVTKEAFNDYEGEILILCGDVPLLKSDTLQKLLSYHREKNAACTVLTANLIDPARYGRIVRDDKGNVKRIVEFKDADENQRKITEINTGVYCFDAKSLFNSLSKIDNNNNQNEYYLTDTLEILNTENKTVTSMIIDDFSETLGINSQKQLTELETILYGKIKEYWLTNGVMIENPASVIIGEDVILENDIFIGANSTLKGTSKIEKGSVIGANSMIIFSKIGKDAKLQGYNVIVNSKVKDNEILDYFEKR